MAADSENNSILAEKNPRAELGARALRRLLAGSQSELSAKQIALYEGKIEFIASLWRIPAASEDALPLAFPFLAVKQEDLRLPWQEKLERSQTTWTEVVEACQILSGEGCRIPAFSWLCVSLFYSDPDGCFADVAGTLFGLATLLSSPVAWGILGIPAVPEPGVTLASPVRKARERGLRDLRWLARALLSILESLRESHKTAASKEVSETARALSRRLLSQGGAPLLACAESVRRLGLAVGPWIGEVAKGDDFFKLEPLRELHAALIEQAGHHERGEAPSAAASDSAESPSDSGASSRESEGAARGTPAEEGVATPSLSEAPSPPRRAPGAASVEGAANLLPSRQPGGAKNPLPYLARRTQLWTVPPPAIGDCSGPTSDDAQKLLAELDQPSVQPIDGLDRAEALLLQYPFWLELQPRVIGWLAELGATRACEVVRSLWLALLEQQPQLLGAECRMSSGVRPLSSEVQAFAREEAVRFAELPPPPRAPRAIDRDAALRSLQQQVLLAPAARQRFLLRIEMAELCHRSRSLDLAVALVTALLEDAHSYRLGEWEPSLLRRVLLLFLSLSEEREIALPKEARGQILAQLSRIDPVEASLR